MTMSDFDVLLFFTFCIIFHFVYAGFLCSGNVLILDESHLVWSFHCFRPCRQFVRKLWLSTTGEGATNCEPNEWKTLFSTEEPNFLTQFVNVIIPLLNFSSLQSVRSCNSAIPRPMLDAIYQQVHVLRLKWPTFNRMCPHSPTATGHIWEKINLNFTTRFL